MAHGARSADATSGNRHGLIPSNSASCVSHPAWPDKALFRMRAKRTLRPVFADCSSRPAGVGQNRGGRRDSSRIRCAHRQGLPAPRLPVGPGDPMRPVGSSTAPNCFPAREGGISRPGSGPPAPIRLQAPAKHRLIPVHLRSRTFMCFFESPTARFAFRGTQCDLGRLADSGPAACYADAGGPPGSAPTHGNSRHLLTSAAAARSGLLPP